MTILNFILLGLFLATALWTVLSTSLLRAAIALAVTSASLTLLMFQMDSALAAVFELSVCAGLITVVFVSTISLTRTLHGEQQQSRVSARRRRFLGVVPAMALVGGLMWAAGYTLDVQLPPPGPAQTVRDVLWATRRLDVLGQVVVLFAGIFGVVVLFKEKARVKAAERARLALLRQEVAP